MSLFSSRLRVYVLCINVSYKPSDKIDVQAVVFEGSRITLYKPLLKHLNIAGQLRVD